MKLYPTKEQQIEFYYWLRVARYVFNWTLDFIRSCQNWNPSWMEIKGYATKLLPEWTKKCPYQIKGIAIKEAHQSYWKTVTAHNNKLKDWKKKGCTTLRPKLRFNFRSRKEPVQSCFIPKSAIKPEGIYPTISGKGLKYAEDLPEIICDSHVIWRAGKFYLATPERKQRVPYGDNQARVVAIDPGVRTFATFYSNESYGFLGSGDFSRIQRLAHHLDDLLSRITKAGKQQKRSMEQAADRMREKIRNLVNELHHKTALFLVKNFELILLPTFETSQMVGKFARKIRSKTVRSLLTFSHYRFKMFLKHKAFEYGKQVVDVCEAYTSKTHPETGELKNIGGAKRIKLLSGQWVNRDVVGARNILLRALVDSPDLFQVAVNES